MHNKVNGSEREYGCGAGQRDNLTMRVRSAIVKL